MCLSLLFFFRDTNAESERFARISRDVDERVGSEQIRVPPSESPRGWRDCTYIFQDIGNILRDVARPVQIVQIDINTAYAWLSEFPVRFACWSNWQLKITFLSCLNSFRMTSLRAIALIYIPNLITRINTHFDTMNFDNYATFERERERQEFLLIIRIIIYNSCFRRRNSIEILKTDDFETHLARLGI